MVGASAGGVEALRGFVSDLPVDLAVPVLIVLHVSSAGSSVLGSILDRASLLTAAAARDGERLEPGRIYVASPNRHLIVRDGHVHLDHGPRENGHRPAIDPLFRSAADAFGERCCAVVLTGTRDDGTAGLAAVKAGGGTTVVQDPADAAYPGMPASAMGHVVIDAVLPGAQIAGAIAALVNEGRFPAGTQGHRPEVEPPEATPPLATGLVCPECGGRMRDEQRNGVAVLACHVGHVYTPRNYVAEQADATERAVWTAVRALDDRAAMLRRMAEQAKARGQHRSATLFEAQAGDAAGQAGVVRATLAPLGDALRRAPDEDEPIRGVAP